jgi:predicted permease
MKALRRFVVRLLGSIGRRRDEKRLRDEIEEHLALQTADNIRLGLSREEARRQALLKFGPVEAHKETYRDTRSVPFVEQFLRDVRHAARGLRRNPGFTTVAILTLALGVAATTAVFSIVYGVLIRPLPFPNAERLVQVVQLLPLRPGQVERSRAGLTPDQVAEWRATSRTLAAIGYYGAMSVTLTGVPTPVRMNGARVSVHLFRALGVAPVKGRMFVDEDEARGNEQVVILSYSVWVGRFGGSDDLIGTSIALNERPYRVVGVMPRGFGFPSIASPSIDVDSAGELASAPEFWMPIVARSRPKGPATGGMTMVPTLALLSPSATIAQATAEVNTLMPAREGERFPVEIVNARTEQGRKVQSVLVLFQVAVLFVLIIACINVVNLLLARTAARRHELAIRAALGAGPRQLASYAIAEGLLIGIGGGALGCFLAYQVVALFRTLPPNLLPRMAEIRVDTAVLALTCATSIVAGLGVGSATVIRIARRDLIEPWSPWSSRTVSAGTKERPSKSLVIVETAAGMILLTGASLLLNSFVKLIDVDRGFNPDDVYTFNISLPQERYRDSNAQHIFHDQFSAALRQIPNVHAVGVSTGLLGEYAIGFSVELDGKRIESGVAYNHITPGVFETLGIPLSGRDFSLRDRTQHPTVAIVNKAFARRFLGTGNPLGRRIGFQDWPALEIVGVVGDIRMSKPNTDVSPAIYLPPDGATPFRTSSYVVRASDTVGLPSAVRAVASRLDSDVVVFNAMTMNALLAHTVSTPKIYAMSAVIFAGLGTTLAALGVYGVLAYSIATRTRELAIRMALGAEARTVLSGVMREGLAMVIVGIGIGTAGALYMSRFLRDLLFGVQPHDPSTFAVVATVFLLTATLACYLPARRAARVDPLVALKYE